MLERWHRRDLPNIRAVIVFPFSRADLKDTGKTEQTRSLQFQTPSGQACPDPRTLEAPVKSGPPPGLRGGFYFDAGFPNRGVIFTVRPR